MGDELLPYYNEELGAIRQLAAEFANEHPKIAGRLRISPDAIEDPHVGRLIEAFAYLNARIRHKLDDEFPELTDALLGVLYPHYLAPIPSMAITEFRAAADLTSPYVVMRGVEIETAPIDGEPCRFRTCYATTLWPIEVEAASVAGTALGSPQVPGMLDVESVLKLTLRCRADEVTFADLGPNTLRFYLRGQPQVVFPLYQLLCNDLLQIAVVNPAEPEQPTLMAPADLVPVGFGEEEGLLPYPAQAFAGYRLLTEFFTFPEKFLFLDFTGLSSVVESAGNRIEVFFYFRRRVTELEQKVNASTFALGCTPIVNLYPKRAEPIQLDHTIEEYRVVPDARRPKAAEVYSVDRVVATGPEGAKQAYQPFFGLTHGQTTGERHTYWRATRRPGSRSNPGTELYLSFVDTDLNPAAATKWVANLETTCLNRDLPGRLPFGGGEPKLRLTEGAAAVEHLACLTAPTRTLRPPRRRAAIWRLISHLTLNHLSISDRREGADALRELLKLYDFRDSPDTRAIIDGVVGVTSRATTARVRGVGTGVFARGVEVEVELDEKRFTGSGVYLFACVLERFLALYCSVNSFTRLTAKLRDREGVLRRWDPRAGDKPLL